MTQAEALSILKTGGNVFLTGEPGAGKTYVLNQYIEWLEDCGVTVAVTASTGIAATHIGGMTIHAWSGIGAHDELSAYDLEHIATKEKVVRRVKNAKVLVIDEISMLDGRLLDMVERVCRAVRQRDDAFGGLQAVLVGDFFQLPPIAARGAMARFAFESNAWSAARFLTCYLTEQYRHEDDLLSSLLTSIRRGEVEEEHYTLLSEQKEIAYEHIEPTRLFTHNKDVDAMNAAKLRELQGTVRTFRMTSRGAKPLVEGLQKSCLSPEALELKEEAMVMCTKNNFEQGYVNGTLGRVVRFDADSGFPIIATGDGRELTIAPASWGVEENGKMVAEITQVPLRLAWAITVHKSQGMSLDAAEIDLQNAFTYGQGYVALSRVRTLAGMKIRGLGPNALMVDPKIIALDATLREESKDALDAFVAMDEEELRRMHAQFVIACGGSLPKDGERRERRPRAERALKESTHTATAALIRQGMSVREAARERNMAESTIWGHVERLAADGTLLRADLEALASKERGWPAAYRELSAAFDANGAERLKPVFEACGERYDYDLVRLARVLYLLGN
jgi:hypothetical protein